MLPLFLYGAPAVPAEATLPSLSTPGFPGTVAGGLSSGMRSVLPAQEAFALTALVEAPDTLVFMWEIRDGYYLYKDSLSFLETNGARIGEAVLPEAEATTDEFFGDVEVYYDRLIVEIPFTRGEQAGDIDMIELQLSYQGCAEAGYCYPMQHETVSLEVL